mmetsp:Transcript_9634/g.12724  ORF Transcript_9634/g.12724 Transcript_9634/m.12724 type:complete len:662 (+) Transcript_9634:235-2220(+)
MTKQLFYHAAWPIMIMVWQASVCGAFAPGLVVPGVAIGRGITSEVGAAAEKLFLNSRGGAEESRLWMSAPTSKQEKADADAPALSIDDVVQELKEKKADFDIRMAAVASVADAEAVRREYLGKKGPLNKVMSYMRLLSAEDKPKLGAVVNEIKQELETAVSSRLDELKLQKIQEEMEGDRVDVTQPGIRRQVNIGRRHPISMTMEKALDIFTELGYDTVTSVEDSPEIESDYNCFEALNCPKDHPARDMQDTFYLTEDREYMLRTHTSSVQIRQLKNRKPPLRIVAPGRVFRKDDIDATHGLQFHQVEILALEPRGELTLGHLKGTVEHFLKEMFGPSIQVRFRGSYFPFTEPSMEVDVFFRGKWLEVLGCGMVDPNVLEMAGIDPEEYSGFAAGFGVERFAMVIHGIGDLREFTKNDNRFLQQFPHYYDDGLNTFLSGAEREPEPVDIRGTEVPSPFVASLEELQSRHAQQQKLNTKSEKKSSAAKKQPPAAEPTAIDISKLDIRVGVITEAWVHEEADKLFCEMIDIGEEGGPRKIASGLRAYYDVNDLPGQRVLVLANLKERKMLGFPSHGMVLCASGDDQVKFVEPPADAAIGERIFVEGFEGEPATENQVIKKKMLDKIFPDLKTNADGVVTYQGKPLGTSSGPCLPTGLPDAVVG